MLIIVSLVLNAISLFVFVTIHLSLCILTNTFLETLFINTQHDGKKEV